MRQYNFVFYIINQETGNIQSYTEKTIWANNRTSAWETATEWAYNNGYTDFKEGTL